MKLKESIWHSVHPSRGMKCGHLKATSACEPATRFFLSKFFKTPIALCPQHATAMIEAWSEGTDGMQEISQLEFEDLEMVGEVHRE